MSAEPLVVIGGMTATGKTAAALAIARRFDGELVGADSVQVYRELDIGSAKPTPGELGSVRHHLIDVLAPDRAIDAAQYAKLADDAIADIRARGKLPIVVGGTGLWLRALLRGLVALPPVDHALRARLEDEARVLGSPAMHARLAGFDPIAAERIHPNDQMRIVRALEVFEQTGRPLGALQDEHAKGAPRYEARLFVLDAPREALYAKLKARIDAMLAAGWVDEVAAIVERWGAGVRPLNSVGYRQVRDHLVDGVGVEETRRAIYEATRIYTRRQRTWFRGAPTAGTWTSSEALVRTFSRETPA